MNKEHEHDYRRLNDAAVFCRGCGDIKTAEPPICTLPHYPIYPIYPYVPPVIYPTVPWWRPSWEPTWTVTNGTVDTGNTVVVSQGTFDKMTTFTGNVT